MNTFKKPLISLCMIAKDEEANITRCLKSVKDYVDEILLLDTGSKDNTPELAKKLGAKVFYGTWENDFSKARNEIKEKALGEWIFFIDADEELPSKTGKNLKKLTENKDVEGYTFNIINYTSEEENCQKQIGINLRMFKNNPNYYFTGAIHEQILPSILTDNPKTKISHSDQNIIHYGYSINNPKRKAKNLRNITILKNVLSKNPDDGYSHYNLAVSYYINKKLTKAKKHYQKAKKLTPLTARYLPVLYRNFVICLFDLKEYENALNLLEEGIAFFSDYPDLYYLKGQIYAELKLFDLAQKYYKKCLEFTTVNPVYTSTKGVISFLSYENLADVSFFQENYQEAFSYQLKAIQEGAKSVKSSIRLLFFSFLNINVIKNLPGRKIFLQNLSVNSHDFFTKLIMYFEDQLREILKEFPDLKEAYHHLFTLATFRNKLNRKDECS